MSQLDPPVSLGKPENEEHLKYLWSDEVAHKDFDYPEVRPIIRERYVV